MPPFSLSNYQCISILCYIQKVIRAEFNCILVFQIFLLLIENCDQDQGLYQESSPSEDESNIPLQLAIVGRPNVGKSTLLNTLLQEERVLVGPEAGLTRDSVRVQFQYQGRTIYLV